MKKSSAERRHLSPLRGSIVVGLVSQGLRPGLHAVAAPRLFLGRSRKCILRVFASLTRRRLSSWFVTLSEAKNQRGQQAAERRQHVAQRVSAGTRIGQKRSRGAATACSPAREGVLPNCAHVEYAVSQAHGESCPPVDRFGCARQSPVFAAKLEAIARDGVGQHTRERWDTNRTENKPRSGDRCRRSAARFFHNLSG